MMARSPSRIDHAGSPSVIESLRIRGDEVQLGRVLAGICTQEKCARALASLLLKTAALNPDIGHRAARLRVPQGVRSYRELLLTRRSPGAHRKAAGRADLVLGGGGFKLICELKINSKYEENQLLQYLKESPVVAIVRDPNPKRLPARVRSHPHWLGEVAWADISNGLSKLPWLSEREREQWLDLLTVLEENGDFDRTQPPEIKDDDRAFVLTVTSRVISRLRRSKDARHRAFAKQLSASPLFDRGRWARARITDSEGEEYWRIGIRDLHSRTPELAVSWIAWVPARAGQARMHKELEADEFRPTPGGYVYRRTQQLRPGRGEDRVKHVTDAAHRDIRAVIAAGLLDYELDRLEIP